MNRIDRDIDRFAALAALRNQLGKKITTGTEWLRVRELDEEMTALPTSGLEALDDCLGGALPRGQFTEVIEKSEGGAGLVMAALLARARRDRQYVILFDVGSGFTVESFPGQDLEALLWVGCHSAGEAIEALDIASRDENFSLFLLDFRNCEVGEWRSVRSRQWYRVLGQIRQRHAAAVLFADTPVTAVSKRRVMVEGRLGCGDLDRERSLLWERLEFSSAATGEGAADPQPDFRGGDHPGSDGPGFGRVDDRRQAG